MTPGGPPWMRGGERPRWWPEGEPWPPEGAAGHRMRRHFVRRFAAFALVALLVLGVVVGVIASATAQLLGAAQVSFPVILMALLVVLGVAMLGGALRGLAGPLGEVMESADRVAAGDFSARVRPRGPREVRRLARAFNDMAERLERSEAHRRRLLADVAHELRTPLAVIQGNLEGLVDGVYPRDEAHLEPILEETRVAARLLEDLRTLSLAESGALELRRETVHLAVLASDAAAAQRARASAKGVALEVDIPKSVPALELDPVRIREVLVNLLRNALDHTDEGRVRVAASVDGASVVVAVSDTGRGIAADALPHVFDRFHKSAESRGSGLGLAIARDLVRAHGGEIAVESDGVPGRGTTVRFTLPTGDR